MRGTSPTRLRPRRPSRHRGSTTSSAAAARSSCWYPGYNPGGNSLSRSDWEVPLADYLTTANDGRVLVIELDYWRTNWIYGWAFDDGQSKGQRFANKAKSAGAGQILFYGHSLGADVTGRVTQDNLNVTKGYGFGIPCFSSWAPKNKGFASNEGFHRINSGRYIVFSRTSDPASQDNCVWQMGADFSSNSGSVPGHDYMELVYDNDYHRYVNTRRHVARARPQDS